MDKKQELQRGLFTMLLTSDCNLIEELEVINNLKDMVEGAIKLCQSK